MKTIISRFIKCILALILPLLVFSACADSKSERLKRVFISHKCSYALVIVKEQFRLEVYDRDHKLAASYKIGYGHNPDMKPKLYEGDNRTPEGTYYINEILSMDSGKETASYRKLQNMNRHYFKRSAGYHKYSNPAEDLGDNAYGPRYYGLDYPNENDRERYRKALQEGSIPVLGGKPADIGYGIAIHGNNDEDSIGHLCSSGCIRMYNRDIVELEKYVMLSTPVIIIHK